MTTDINEERMKRQGQPMFIQCQCGGEDWAVSCIHGNGKSIINTIVCKDCGDDSTVVYGELRL